MKKTLVIVLVFVSSVSFAQTNESQATYEDYVQTAKDSAFSGQYFEAIQECNKAINLEPKNPWAYAIRAFGKIGLTDYRGAISDCDKSIKLYSINDIYPANDSIYIGIYYLRGLAKQMLSDFKGSLADGNKVIELDSTSAMGYYIRGLAKYGLGDKDGACLDMSKAGELGMADAYEAIKEGCN